MRKKVIIGLFIAIFLVAAGGIIKSMKNPPEEAKMTSDTEIIEDWEITEDMNRPNEEYISIFLDNREDFDYVAEMMKQWPDRSIIVLEDNISCENQELADEIENNAEFYGHLKNLYDLGEIDRIVKWDEYTKFGFNKPPANYHGGWCYWDKMEERGMMTAIKIDEHWTLTMLPNV